MKFEKVLITAALPYANGPLHFGHIAGAYLPADCYARFCRLLKKEVLFVSGSDEYGIAITLSAEVAKKTPQEHVDFFHEVNKNFFKQLDISFDHFSRTTNSKHQIPVQQFFKDLLANGYIEPRITEQLFSEKEQKFLADRYVIGTCPKCNFSEARGDECTACAASYEAIALINPRSKLTEAPLVKKMTKHWFLLLEQFKEKLLKWLENKHWKPNVINFVKGYIHELHARSITRDMQWGIPLPIEDTFGKVLYVWFDAPIGYISATMEWAEKNHKPDDWKRFWYDEKTQLVNFIGKDNIPFHAVIFPSMIMGQNTPLKLVDELPANEFYNLEGRQFSKSEGWFIDLEDFFKKYTSDQIRYTIAANAPETADSEFTWKDFQRRCNGELLGKLGNFVNRVLVFAKNNCQSKMPEKKLETIDSDFLAHINSLTAEAKLSYSQFKVKRASQILMEIAQSANSYFDHKKPWGYLKEQNVASMLTTIACCIEVLKILALVATPLIPNTSEQIFKFLNLSIKDLSWDEIVQMKIATQHQVQEPTILFQKIEDSAIAQEVIKLQANLQKTTLKKSTPIKPLISYQEFDKIDLRVGQIIKAEKIAKSKKLLFLTVDTGEKHFSIVAGLGLKYTPEELLNKKVTILVNLEPTNLMGYVSEGMLLAAGFEKNLEILSFDQALLGAIIK